MVVEPNWFIVFGRKAERETASAYWATIVAELERIGKADATTGHAVMRLVVAYVGYDVAAKNAIMSGAVKPAKKSGVLCHNPWASAMTNAASQAQRLERELCLTPRTAPKGGKPAARRATAASEFLAG